MLQFLLGYPAFIMCPKIYIVRIPMLVYMYQVTDYCKILVWMRTLRKYQLSEVSTCQWRWEQTIEIHGYSPFLDNIGFSLDLSFNYAVDRKKSFFKVFLVGSFVCMVCMDFFLFLKGKLYSFIQREDSIKYNRKGIIERSHKKTKTHIPDPKGITHTRAK